MKHFKPFSVAAILSLSCLLLLIVCCGVVLGQDPTPTASVEPLPSNLNTLLVEPFVGVDIMFVLFAIIVFLVWVLAVVRQTFGLSIISMVCWFAFSAGIMTLGNLDVGWVLWFAYLCSGFGIFMMVMSFYHAFRLFQSSAEGRSESEAVM